VSLVPLTKSASPDETGGAPGGVVDPALQRRRRYQLQKLAVDMLPGHRVCSCGWRPPPGGQIGVSRRGGQHFVSGVAVCGSVWACPVCASKVAVSRAAELRDALGRWAARKGSVWLLTLTIDHTAQDELEVLLKRFTEAMRQLWAGKWGQWWRTEFGQVGMVRNLEVTWGLANGWHPHCHAVLFTRSDRTIQAEQAMRRRWMAVSKRYGFRVSYQRGAMLEKAHELKAAADYATKEDKACSWGASEELTWANIKKARGGRFTPFALLSACEGEDVGAAPMLFQKYVDAFKGRRQLYWSRGLRQLLDMNKEQTDEVVANAKDEQSVFVMAIDTSIFCWLKARGWLCDLLQAGDEGGLPALQAFLETCYDCRQFEARQRTLTVS